MYVTCPAVGCLVDQISCFVLFAMCMLERPAAALSPQFFVFNQCAQNTHRAQRHAI